MEAVTAWLFALMVSVAPPEKLAALPQFPGYEETAAQKTERYESFARDLATVALDPQTKSLFGGADGRLHTAAMMLAIAFMESGFAPDVDRGPCYRGRDGKSTRCDSGRAACSMQIRAHFAGGITTEGWPLQALFEDRSKCFRAGLRALRSSFSACRENQDPNFRLAVYASGSCAGGHRESAARFAMYRRLVQRGRLPGVDADFMGK